ncbi:gliding motility-associated C-terminal domain-containing protein, partial [Flavobacterium macacae]
PAVVSNTASGNYTFTPNAGQCASAVTLNVTVENKTATITEDCIDKNLILQVNPVADSFNIYDVDYIWRNADGIEVGSNMETFNVTEYVSGLMNPVYPMTFTVTISNDCEITETHVVNGVGCNIPKGISPNGDGKNDEFDLTGLNVKELTIFNRYGTKVYSRRNYVKEWKGQTDNAQDLPDATYYYVIQRDGVDAFTGWVYINRQRN